MNQTTTTEITYRAVIIHRGANGDGFARTMNAVRGTLDEAKIDAIRLEGGDFIRPTDDVVVERTVVVTMTEAVER